MGLEGEALWEGANMTKGMFEALGRERRVPWVLVSAGLVVVPHICRCDCPMFMSWPEMLEAWPALRLHASARPAWEQLRADLEDMGVEPVRGHRIGGRHARAVWEEDAWGDRVAEGSGPEVTDGWRGSLDQVADGDGDLGLDEGDWEALLRREYGGLLTGDSGDTARCAYGASREERWDSGKGMEARGGGVPGKRRSSCGPNPGQRGRVWRARGW